MSKTSEYQLTGCPSMPFLMFCNVLRRERKVSLGNKSQKQFRYGGWPGGKLGMNFYIFC